MFAAPFQHVVFIMLMLRCTTADFTCLCNYAVEAPVFSSPDMTSSPTGYMYEFDCKATADTVASSDGWAAIQFEHKVVYIQTSSSTMEQTCQGEIPDGDKLTSQSTTTRASTTPSTTATSKTTVLTTPTSSTSTSTTPASSTSTSTTPSATTPKTTPLTSATTTVPTTTTSTTVTTRPSSTQDPTTVQQSTQTTMTSVPIVSRDPTTSYPTSRHTKHPPTPSPITTSTWTTNSHRSTPTTSDWLIHFDSHGPMNYSTSSTNMHSGNKTTTTPDWLIHWDNHVNVTVSPPHWQNPFGNHGNTTSGSGGTNWHFSQGDLSLCPSSLVQAHSNTSDISQHAKYCYEIHRPYGSWYNAHTDCVRRLGGHLVEPHTADQVSYLKRFLQHAHFSRPVWIGLHDKSQEELFQWDSGARVTYENWDPSRVDNNAPHDVEDCVIMRSNGLWDDRKCERSHLNDPEYQPHPWVCQYHPCGYIVHNYVK